MNFHQTMTRAGNATPGSRIRDRDKPGCGLLDIRCQNKRMQLSSGNEGSVARLTVPIHDCTLHKVRAVNCQRKVSAAGYHGLRTDRPNDGGNRISCKSDARNPYDKHSAEKMAK